MSAQPPRTTGTQRVALVTGATGVVGPNLLATRALSLRRAGRVALRRFRVSSGYDIVSEVGKARRAGFREVVDTEAMFLRVFESYRRSRIIP